MKNINNEKQLIKLNTGRNCLRYLIRLYLIKQLYLPYYCCPVLREAAFAENCKVIFYHINDEFFPVQTFERDDFILYPNYFGICAKNVRKLSLIYRNLIVDNAQAFYMPDSGLASFCSLRKFFPVGNGAYLFCKKQLNTRFSQASNSTVPVSEEEFLKNELNLDRQPIQTIARSCEDIMNGLDTNRIREIRLDKFRKIHKKLKSSNELHIETTEEDVPFVYPYLTKDDEFINTLNKSKIFRYWNNLPKSMPEYKFYRHIIPIPLD